MAGSKALPAIVHKLKGTHQPCRHDKTAPEDVVTVPKGYPDTPAEITGRVLKIWNEIKSYMQPTNLYTAAEKNKLKRYCVLQAQFDEELSEYPATKLAQLRLLENDLYLDIETRIKLGLSAGDKPSNPFEELMS